MTKPTQSTLLPTATKAMRERTPAQRAWFAANAPMTAIQRAYPEQHRVADLYPAGTLLAYEPLGLILAYRYTFEGQDCGAMVMGTVVDRLADVCPALGSEWARRATELRRVVRRS